MLSPHYADKATMDVKAIGWHNPDEEVLAGKKSVPDSAEQEFVGKGDDKDVEIKALKNRVAELEMLLQLNRSNKLNEPEFILCDKPEEDDPDSYVDLVCSGVRGDLYFESPLKEEKKMEEDKPEEKKTRSIIIRLKAKSRKRKLDSNYEYYYLKKAEKVEEKEKKKKMKKKKGVEEKEEDVVVEMEEKDVGKDIQEEMVHEGEEKEEDVELEKGKKNVGKEIQKEMLEKGVDGEDQNQLNKVVSDLPTFDLNINLSLELDKQVDSDKDKLGKVAEETTAPLIEEVIEVDELPTPNDEVVGKFLPVSRMKDRLAFLDTNEREVVQRFFKKANKSYVLF